MEFFVGLFGGLARILLGLLDWQFRTKEPFNPDKFFQALVSALVTGGIFQLTLDVNFGAQELLLGWGTAEATNKVLSLSGIGPLLSNLFKNVATVFKSRI